MGKILGLLLTGALTAVVIALVFLFFAPPLKPGLGPVAYTHITGATNTQIKSGPGVLHTVTINNPGAGGPSVTMFDDTSCAGAKIGTIVPTAHATLTYDVTFRLGLCVGTGGGTPPDLTVASH